jgi:hypothetical protein
MSTNSCAFDIMSALVKGRPVLLRYIPYPGRVYTPTGELFFYHSLPLRFPYASRAVDALLELSIMRFALLSIFSHQDGFVKPFYLNEEKESLDA